MVSGAEKKRESPRCDERSSYCKALSCLLYDQTPTERRRNSFRRHHEIYEVNHDVLNGLEACLLGRDMPKEGQITATAMAAVAAADEHYDDCI